MPLPAGHKLAHYEILEPIGRGGMGEVYRAKDGKLGRDVAIKVLPDEFAQDEERLRRFQREAKVLASLNHPNIASIYGLEQSGETHYLVLELVPGETLAERIARGPVPVEEALDIAKKIAGALEEAHEQGIVHRDLKPANVKLTEDGKVKVLDFGLAKAFVEEGPEGDAASSMSPTITRDATRVGVILGTAAYMSPEQAKGKRVDKRTDIFAFGAVLYEMLTGKRAFQAEDVSETLAHVLTKEPAWESIPENTPLGLRQALRVCLVKDPKRRIRDISDVRLTMEGTFEETPEVLSRISGWRPRWAIAGALALAILTGVVVWNLRPEASRQVARLRSSFPTGVALSTSGVDLLAVSRDGTRLAYVANDQIYLQAIDQTEAVPLRGTEGGNTPFFSPDGEWLGFAADGKLKKLPVRGGTPISLCDAQNVWGAFWAADGAILFSERGTGILQVSANGGAPEVIVPVDAASGFSDSPQLLPGGVAVLFTLGDGANWDDAQIVAQSPSSSERKVLIEGGRGGRYVETGHLAYVRAGTLYVAPFDLDRMETTGAPVPVAERVMAARGFAGAAQFGVSDAGSLVYITGDTRENRTLVWVDRNGEEEAIAADPRAYVYPRISPDGSQLALDVRDQDEDIWIWHFERKTLTRFTFNPGMDSYPTWSPDGRRLAFASAFDGLRNLYEKAADGTGAIEQLTDVDTSPVPLSYSPDGSRMVFRQYQVGQTLDVGLLSSDGSVTSLIAAAYSETNAEISPNGAFVAYQSDESGRDEIYVRPFPDVEDGRWQVSTGGATRPLWGPDGQELFYLSNDGALAAARVQTEPAFAVRDTETLFDVTRYAAIVTSPGRSYDISPDGERFLMIKNADQDSSSVELVFVLNWFEELKRLVPTN